MQLSELVCECDILRVVAICDISQNMLWYAPKYEYLTQTVRAQKAQYRSMMKPQEDLVKQPYTE